MQLEALETISVVEAAEPVRSLVMVKLEARPHKRAQNDFLFLVVLHQVPAALGFVGTQWLEEERVERRSWQVKVGSLLFILYVTEVHVVR